MCGWELQLLRWTVSCKKILKNAIACSSFVLSRKVHIGTRPTIRGWGNRKIVPRNFQKLV